jgi:hypothetical protein
MMTTMHGIDSQWRRVPFVAIVRGKSGGEKLGERLRISRPPHYITRGYEFPVGEWGSLDFHQPAR